MGSAQTFTTTMFIASLLLLVVLITNIHTTSAASSSTQTYKIYLKLACNSTTYPGICYKSLSSYASTIKTNPKNLCKVALSVTLKAARTASSTVSKLSKQSGLTKSETGVIKDCVETIKDSIDELKQSLSAMSHLNGTAEDVQFQLDDIKTWVSSAITDDDTCTDGFQEQKVSAAVKATIKNSIVTVAKLASNALSLVNTLVY